MSALATQHVMSSDIIQCKILTWDYVCLSSSTMLTRHQLCYQCHVKDTRSCHINQTTYIGSTSAALSTSCNMSHVFLAMLVTRYFLVLPQLPTLGGSNHHHVRSFATSTCQTTLSRPSKLKFPPQLEKGIRHIMIQITQTNCRHMYLQLQNKQLNVGLVCSQPRISQVFSSILTIH